MRLFRWSTLLFLLAACEAPENEGAQEDTSTGLERTAKVDTTWLNNLYEVEVLGEFPTANKAPFKVMRARGCTECDANLAIYVYSPSDGPVGPEHEQVRYPYPGALIDPFEGDTLMRTRTFIGEIAPDVQGLWWHIEQFEAEGEWHASTFLITITGDTVQSRADGPTLAQMEAWTSGGRVRELSGLDQMAEP